jgi:hypothetical protein
MTGFSEYEETDTARRATTTTTPKNKDRPLKRIRTIAILLSKLIARLDTNALQALFGRNVRARLATPKVELARPAVHGPRACGGQMRQLLVQRNFVEGES